jgi:hypothetical protein
LSTVAVADQIRRVQRLTIVWMAGEFVAAVFAGFRAHSVVLTAFGADSGIEMVSAFVVSRRFGTRLQITERTASLATAWLLIALVIYIIASSLYGLVATIKPEPSYFGIAVLIASALIMPWLARRKRKLADTSQSSSLRADAAQSSLCGYLAWIALGGLTLNTLAGIFWADPVAALALLPFVISEARHAWIGDRCCE